MPGTGQIVRLDVIAGLKYWSLYLIFFFHFRVSVREVPCLG